MSTIALRLLDPKFQSVEKTQEFRSRRWSERNIFHKNRIFSKLIEISIAVEISNDLEFFFIEWIIIKSVFLFFTLLSLDQNWQI